MLFKLKIFPLVVAAAFSLIGCNSDSTSASSGLIKEQPSAHVAAKPATQVSLSQLQSGVTLSTGDWLKDGIEDTLQTDVAIRAEAQNDYLVTTTFRQPVQLGVGGFDATGLGRFLMCFSNDLALKSKAHVWLFVGLKADMGQSLSNSQVHNYHLILLQPDDPALKLLMQKGGLKAMLKAMQKRYPLYHITESSFEAVDDPLYQGAYCGFYKSNFVN
jgi:hypothetical protein